MAQISKSAKDSPATSNSTVEGITPRDVCVMDTNNSSIVSKRSVEKLYFPGEDFFRPFVRKYQRRSPLINRGYYLRMKVIDHTVYNFLREDTPTYKLVVNLGCGYDPLPFQFLGRHPDLCRNTTFVDVDYPTLLRRKVQAIRESPTLTSLLRNLRSGSEDHVELAAADGYRAIGCDLRHLDVLETALRESFPADHAAVAVLFVAEVSVAYMDRPPADALLKWAASFTDDARFCLLEQHLPDGRDHPFAQTMLKHFDKLRTPLNAIGTLDDMRQRFTRAGWPVDGVAIRSLWELWLDHHVVPPSLKHHLDTVEPFDEWEEFALFGSHYFLLVARTKSPFPSRGPTPLSYSDPPSVAPSHDHIRIGDKVTGRRFGVTAVLHDHERSRIIHCGGHGIRERLSTFDSYTTIPSDSDSIVDTLPSALVCHTLTSCGTATRPAHLLCGGRNSPDKPSSSCWMLEDNHWTRVADLPRPRYRHCAVAASINRSVGVVRGVLVFGGRSGTDTVLDDWLLWTADQSWIPVTVEKTAPSARFAASMVPHDGGRCGLLLGGIDRDGNVLDDSWEWTLSTDGDILQLSFAPGPVVNGRFGAQLVQHGPSTLLIGGASGSRLLTHDEEIVNVYTGTPVPRSRTNRPLLVGFSAVNVPTQQGPELLILGGGATCFSFGTCWSHSLVLRAIKQDKANVGHWAVAESSQLPNVSLPSRLAPHATPGSIPAYRSPPSIQHLKLNTSADFTRLMRDRQPAVIQSADLGPCTSLWDLAYLESKIGSDRTVTVHECKTPHLNFTVKNFRYATRTFGEFRQAIDAGQHVYLRSTSVDSPLAKPADLATDFPALASDFQLPTYLAEYVDQHRHSCPLRISGRVSMWLHYDVMANILCQIRGRKRMILFPPSEVTNLWFAPGSSSSSLNIFTQQDEGVDGAAANRSEAAAAAAVAARQRAITIDLEPGDVLFLPPLWLHAAEPTEGTSVAVNVFFRDEDMSANYAAGRDVYGNRDIAAYERGRRDAGRMVAAFDGMPDDVRAFYLDRLAEEVRLLARSDSRSI